MNQKQKIFRLALSVFLIFYIFLGQFSPAAAQTGAPAYSGVQDSISKYLCTPTGTNDFYSCVTKLYKFAVVVVGILGMFFIIIAGYTYMTAGGNAESVANAKSRIIAVIMAFAVLALGYLFLKTLNPDIVNYQPIQPANVATLPGQVGTNAAADLTGSGCAFQTNTQKTESAQLVPQLEAMVKNICYNVLHNYTDTTGHPATISSVIGLGQHTENSYHYKGCAVDFADGGGAGFFNPSTKQGRPTGVAIYKEALAAGISPDRINPGTDATRTDMLHIDLGNSCPNS